MNHAKMMEGFKPTPKHDSLNDLTMEELKAAHKDYVNKMGLFKTESLRIGAMNMANKAMLVICAKKNQPVGTKLVEMDYSQIELRLAADTVQLIENN